MVKIFNKNNVEFVLSGSCAIITVLYSNLKKGAKVVIPNNVCVRVLESVLFCDLYPIIVSPKNGLTLEAEDIEKVKRKSEFDAIIVVHNYGVESDVKKIRKNNSDVLIVEDCAQYWGDDESIGLFSDYVITSIDVNKPLVGKHTGLICHNNKKTFLDRGVTNRYDNKLNLPFLTSKKISSKLLYKIIKKASKINKKNNKFIHLLNNVLNKYDDIIFPNKECNNLKYPIVFKKRKDYLKFIELADSNNFKYSEPHEKNLEELPMLNYFEFSYVNNQNNKFKNQIYIKTKYLSRKYIKNLDDILRKVFL